MDHFFSTNPFDEDLNEKISLDELYDRKREVEVSRMNIYRRILNRVHAKIKMASRQKNNDQFTFFVVPEFLFGVPKYDVSTCISYIIDKLEENGFLVKYTHPNLLFISWKHYIPAYKREQIKKETGKAIDGFGNLLPEKSKKDTNSKDPASIMLQMKDASGKTTSGGGGSSSSSNSAKKSEYKDVSTYKPKGIYSIDLITKINDKLK